VVLFCWLTVEGAVGVQTYNLGREAGQAGRYGKASFNIDTTELLASSWGFRLWRGLELNG